MRVGTALDGHPGLLETRVDVPNGRVTVSYDPAATTLADLRRRLDASPQYHTEDVIAVREVRDGVARAVDRVGDDAGPRGEGQPAAATEAPRSPGARDAP